MTEAIGPDPAETAEVGLADPTPPEMTETIEQRFLRVLETLDTRLEEQNSLLKELVKAANSHTTSLEWLTDNTAGLFNGFAQMQANGGPAALLGMLKG